MLKEWSDREPDPPLPKGWRMAQYAVYGILIVLIGWRLIRLLFAIFS